MSEYASKIALGAVVAVIVGSLLVAGFYYLPQRISPSSTTQASTVVGSGGTTLVTVGGTTQATTDTTVTLPTSIPKELLGYLSTQNVSCSLASGVCTFTIVNNSTDPLDLETCGVTTVSSSGTVTVVTVYTLVNGTIGGPATAGIPAYSQVTATCTIPITQLAHQTEGSPASGIFTVKLVNSWYSYPAGDEPSFSFEGTWGNLTTVTVTEEIIQQSIYTQRACTEQLGVTNTTTFITPTATASQTDNNNTVTITEIQFSNSTSTTTISPPPVITTIINGTTILQSCG